MNPRVRGALVGAVIGAGIGALYGFMFVAYRERMAAQLEPEQTVEVPEPASNGQVMVSPEVRDPERQPEHRGERMRRITGRARELRAAAPDMAWRDAMRQAAREVD